MQQSKLKKFKVGDKVRFTNEAFKNLYTIIHPLDGLCKIVQLDHDNNGRTEYDVVEIERANGKKFYYSGNFKKHISEYWLKKDYSIINYKFLND